jgi:hypothetical protein
MNFPYRSPRGMILVDTTGQFGRAGDCLHARIILASFVPAIGVGLGPLASNLPKPREMP